MLFRSLMTGDMLTARQAEALGLVNYAVPAAELDAKVDQLVAKLAGNPKWAVRWTKTVTNIPLRALAAQLMALRKPHRRQHTMSPKSQRTAQQALIASVDQATLQPLARELQVLMKLTLVKGLACCRQPQSQDIPSDHLRTRRQ